MSRFALLVGCLVAVPLLAQDTLEHAELPLAHGQLQWTAGGGLTVLLAGQPVFAAPGTEFVLHDQAWTKQLFNSRTPATTRLTQADGRTVLTVTFAADQCHAEQVITAGPGDQFEITWRWRQDKFDGPGLQLAFTKPVESYFAGAAYEATVGGQPVTGTIPVVYDAKRPQPISGAAELTVRSLFGTVKVAATQPMALYDYAKRHGAFWLGCDLPAPRGQDGQCTYRAELAAPDLTFGDVRLTGLNYTGTVTDGQAMVSLKLATTAAGRRPVRLSAELRGEGAPASAEATAELTGQPQTIEVRLPAPRAGQAALHALLQDGDRREVLRLPVLPVTVVPPMAVTAGRSFYTTEKQAELYVRVRPELAGRTLEFTAAGGRVKLSGRPVPGERTALSFDPALLAEGANELVCRLSIDGRPSAEAPVSLRKLPPKPNEVKIEYAGRGLIVDGLPMLPFGFYVKHPALTIAEEELPFGFTHLAPYRNRSSRLDSDARQAEMIAVLDRYAALGMKVHYDVRDMTCADDTPEKWAALKREVEAVRNHPALLAWYLADEPELQGIPPERLAASCRFVKDLDPYHPCTQVFADRGRAAAYLGGMDIIMADPYPIPNAPVTRVAETTRFLNEAIGNSIPLWIVPQAFGGGEWWAREPSPDEERVMTYLALIHGATGIQYFIREPAHIRPLPQLLSACRALAAEAAELTPALTSPQPRPVVQSADANVQCSAWRTTDAVWVLAANTANRPLPVKLTVAGAVDGQAEVLFKDRQVPVTGGQLTDWIDGFGTRAYRLPLQPEDPHAGLAAGNLVKNPSFEEQHVPGSPDGYYLGGRPDPGAQVWVDSRLAKHGRHSLRVVAPADGTGYYLAPFPVPLKAGQTYRVSFWARSLRPGVKVNLGAHGLKPASAVFTLTDDWREYELVGRAPKDERNGQLGYRLQTAGTAWFDLLQMTAVEKTQ